MKCSFFKSSKLISSLRDRGSSGLTHRLMLSVIISSLLLISSARLEKIMPKSSSPELAFSMTSVESPYSFTSRFISGYIALKLVKRSGNRYASTIGGMPKCTVPCFSS